MRSATSAGTAFVAVLCSLVLVAGAPPRESVRDDRPNLILISLDTTRADALSCYGQPPDVRHALAPVTPHLDALAEEGVRFARFYAQAPVTLNSHVTMMTGLDPHQHAVPRNGFPFENPAPTLAERLGKEGYDTIAVVGSAALERSMGLDRGFRIYDDALSAKQSIMYQDRAAGVRARAEAALADHESGRPLFLFVHLYDPHAPYDAPEPWKMAFVDPEYRGLFAGKRFQRSVLDQALKNGTAEPADLDYVASRYLGEVAYVDEQIGLLLDSLRAQGLLEHALVAVVADHGETLGERSFFAYSHGSEVTDEVMRVPLILRGYGVPLATHAVVQRQAEMAGLAPTLEVALGLRPTLGTARPFYDLVRPGPVADEDGWPERPTRTVLMEAARPRDLEDAARWNNLTFARGVRAGGWVLRLSPAYDQPPRLWDGPGDQVHITDDAIRPVLAGLLGRWDLDSPPHRTEVVTADTHEALRALGYLDDGRPTGSPVDNLGDEGEVPPDP